MSQDLWSKLEVELDKNDPASVEIPDGELESKSKLDFRERLVASFLNGFFPSLLICLLAYALMWLLEERVATVGLGYLLILPLAALFRPLVYRSTKPSRTFLFLAPLFLGGCVELFSTSLDFAEFKLVSEHKGNLGYVFLNLFENHLEEYLSWSHFLPYLALGLCLPVVYGRLEKRYFWFDLKPVGRLRWLVTLLLAVTPVVLGLIAGGILVFHDRFHGEQNAWLQEQQKVTAASPEPSHFSTSSGDVTDSPIWANLRTELSLSEFDVFTASEQDAETIQGLEKALLAKLETLLATDSPEKADVWIVRMLFQKLLSEEESDKLQQPEKLALAHLHFDLIYSFYLIPALKETLSSNTIPYLCEAPLHEIENSGSKLGLPSLFESFENLERADALIHRYLFMVDGFASELESSDPIARDYNGPRVRKLNFLGLEIKNTPARLFFRWKKRESLVWWMRIRAEVTEEGRELQGVLRGAYAESNYEQRELISLVSGEHGSFKREFLTLSKLIYKLRKYRDENGSWPKNLSTFMTAENIQKSRQHEFDFDAQTGELTYTDKASAYQASQTWKLR